jgi:Zn-dependent metalloprotease
MVLSACLLLTGLVVATPAASGSVTRLRIVRERGTAAPAFVSGISEHPASGSPAAIARDHLKGHMARYGIEEPQRDLRVLDVIKSDGAATVRFGQRLGGVDVFGAQYLVHLRRTGSGYAPYAVNGHFFTELRPDIGPRLGARAAERIARLRYPHLIIGRIERRGAVVLPVGAGIHAYHFTLWGHRLDGAPLRQEVYVNSSTGAIALSYNNVQADGPVVGTGVRVVSKNEVPLNIYQRGTAYEARDRLREMFATSGGEIITHDAKGAVFETFDPTDATVATDPDTRFDKANTRNGIVDAHWGAGVTYEFYRALGRNSIDDNGMDIISVANTKAFGGQPFDNAFWDGEKMVYGKGTPRNFYPFSSALDVVAHELTHGVTEFSGGLVYLNQPGAMNEAYSDYFGNAVQDNAEGIPMTSPEAGQLGEDLCKRVDPEHPVCPFRDLNDGATVQDYIFLMVEFDNGGVHENSTIYSGALWDIREQLDPVDADRLVYKALTEFTTPLDAFTDGRNSLLAAASALGMGSGTAAVINEAFDSRGLVDGWDVAAPNDATVLRENVAPFGFEFSAPKASGDRYVIADAASKMDLGSSPNDIFVGNLDASGTTEKVTPSPGPATLNNEQPDISGDAVVWARLEGDAGDAQAADFDVVGRIDGQLETIAGGKGWQLEPAIDGRLVAWVDDTPRNTSVWARYLGGKKVRLSSDRRFRRAFLPQVSGNWVVWFEGTGTAMYNMMTEKRVVIKRSTSPPAAGGGYAAWLEDADFRPRAAVVTMNLKTLKRRVVIQEKSKDAPKWGGLGGPPVVSVNSRYIAFTDATGFVKSINRPNFPADRIGRDVYLVPVSGGAARRVTCNRGDQAYPALGRSARVAWLDTSRAQTDLMSDVGAEAGCSISSGD